MLPSYQQWQSVLLLSVGFTLNFLRCCAINSAGPSFYSFTVEDINGDVVSLAKFSGQVSLVVNVASECGYTDEHYKGLDLIQDTFGHTGRFNVLAFPCNQFGGQEPGTSKEILDFVRSKTKSAFPLFAKVNVINTNVSPAWVFLEDNAGKKPTWNFFKYLVDHTGHVINAWGPDIPVEDLRSDIQKAILNVRPVGGKDEF